ncbi:MAG: hypothetical protein GVY18_08230 [Bacteroidetes bacterium]|jgi:hypothetical protein|nr:hypothetical protein [Bacteroidota bacterium]
MTPGPDVLGRLEATFTRWAEQHYGRLLIGLCLATVAYNGMAFAPGGGYLALAVDPFTAAPAPNYAQGAPLLPLVAHVLGATTPTTFFILCLSLIGGGFGLLAVALRNQGDRITAALAMLLVAAHPVTTVLLAWVGMPDALTFLFAAALLFVRHPAALLGIGVLGAFNHPILVFAGPSILLLRVLAEDDAPGYGHLAAVVGGVLGGLAAAQGYQALFDIQVVSRLDYVLQQDLDYWLWINRELPHIVFSGHGLLWVALALSGWTLYRQNRRYVLALVGLQAAFLGIMFFTEDSTRVFALLAWAPALHAILYALRQDASGALRRAVLALGALAWITPGYYVWESRLFAAPFYDAYRFLFAALGLG